METKKCNVCEEELRLDKFTKGRYTCRDCRNKKRRGRSQKFKSKVSSLKECNTCGEVKLGKEFSSCNENTDGLRGACKECTAFSAKKRIFGVGREEYNTMLKEQGNCCKICKGTDIRNKNNTKFHIDHCHDTGKVRGLLCDACNRGIGFLRDNKDIILTAAEYVANEGDI